MEKRVFIAILLSFGVMYAYSLIFPPAPHQAGTPKVQRQVTSAQGSAQLAVPVSVTPPAPGGLATAKDVVIDTDLYTAVFSTRGGILKRFTLKKYTDAAGAAGKPIELVSATSPDHATLKSQIPSLGIGADTVYSVVGSEAPVSKGETRRVEFTATLNGIVFTKRLTFQGGSYGIELEQLINNSSSAKVDGGIQLVLQNAVDAKASDSRFETHGAVSFSDNGLHSDSVKDLAKGPRQYDKSVLWTGFNDKYFLSSILAQNNSIAGVKVQQNGNIVENVISFAPFALNPGQAVAFPSRMYFGPKDLDILKAQGNNLEAVIDLGWFSVIAKPLLHTLKFFYKYTGNYGLAIIIITIILKLLFFPLTHKSYKSMKDMQKLQPKMAQLKEKYKNDRDALNKAVMELYQTHKVNPIGGCLPMIVQIPVFFALYKALMFSIELRHAPFFLWIHDLAAKDPYYVTPLIMGVTMFVQQKMTPSTSMDPMQAKMMMALPVVFTFMFLNFPSGLVLYWLVNNTLTIAQQYYINKKIA